MNPAPVEGLFNDYDTKVLGVDLASGPDRTERILSKKAQHRQMRSLGMGKHVAGNAHSLANHQRVPGNVAVGEGKTVAQWKAEKRQHKKKKNKMARKSRARNR